MIRSRGGQGWRNDITIKEEHRFHSSFQDAAIAGANNAIKFLSPSDQINLALEVMGKQPVDTQSDAEREDRLDTITNALSGLVAEVKAIKAASKPAKGKKTA